MKKIDINNIDSYTNFITRQGKLATLIKYVPKANIKTRLLFMVDGNILGCDESGVCWTVNSYSDEFTETSYHNYDVFYDDKVVGWVNLYKVVNKEVLAECSKVYRTYEEAKKASKENVYRIVKIEWSLEDESEEAQT